MKISFLSFAASLLFAALISQQVLSVTTILDHNISITIAERESEVSISAKYPFSNDREINSMLNDYFKMHENIDSRSAEIVKDLYPDQSLNFELQSGPGKLKMKMIKLKNTPEGLLYFKAFGEKLKIALAKKTV